MMGEGTRDFCCKNRLLAPVSLSSRRRLILVKGNSFFLGLDSNSHAMNIVLCLLKITLLSIHIYVQEGINYVTVTVV